MSGKQNLGSFKSLARGIIGVSAFAQESKSSKVSPTEPVKRKHRVKSIGGREGLECNITQASSSKSERAFSELIIGSLPTQLQEYAIIEDLLFVMMGIEGKYIEVNKADGLTEEIRYIEGIDYVVDSTLDPSLKDLAERILPLATYYTAIEAFVETYSEMKYGFVNHALCGAIRELLKEYLILITQLEHQFRTSSSFTLQKFWFYVHPTLHTMSNIHSLVMEIRDNYQDSVEDDDSHNGYDELLNCDGFSKKNSIPQQVKGGGILSILSFRMSQLSGDPDTKKLYIYLLSRASKPYISMMHTWIHHGEIRDPYDEFMIQERKNVKKEHLKEDFNDTYWEMRYTIRENTVPPFLVPFQKKILLAGKYLNVIRECGIAIEEPRKKTIDESVAESKADRTDVNVNSDVLLAMDGGRFVENIEIAYKRANRTLLDLLLKDQQLLARLRSIKRYFFLDQSDFFTHFLDLAWSELKKPSTQVSITKLQSLLDLVLRNPSSVAYTDPFKEDVKVEMSSVGLVEQLLRIINVEPTAMTRGARSITGTLVGGHSTGGGKQLTGIEALSLDYVVTFPLSLVISRKALTKYQLLFRHLLYLKYVEQLLCNIWTEHFKSFHWREESGHPSITSWKNRMYALRQRMLVFIQQFSYYVTNEVLERQWRILQSNLAKLSTVDQVLEYHTDFLDTCLKECMLTNAKLLRIFAKLTHTCVLFANYTDKFRKSLMALKSQTDGNNSGAVSLEQQEKTLHKFEDNFLYHIKLLIEALNFYSATETVQFLCLVVRLDYNLYYYNQPSKR
ncbi:4583_t:CDS:10 [Paraglomus occultum]|uniref:Spindle pole body component n=1 Tax=Paraglomus occultum TaxID=144539 RepID=A0A9N8Z4H2_9GLOM|nr:4583_t:CDS:10 [Paraglomus occultum]